MASRRRYLSYLVLTIILVLALPACVRPFGQSEAEQAGQATQEAESQAAEEAQADEEAAETGQEAGGLASEAEETIQEETEAGAAEEGAEGEEAVSSDLDVGGETPDTEEEAPEVVDEAETEGAPSTEEDAEAVETTEGETEMGEEMSQEVTAEEEPVQEAAAEEEMTEEPEAAESMPSTLPATHTVAPGENLFRIGLKYGLSWIPLAIYNDISNPNLIYTGQVIRIPGGEAPPTTTAPEEATDTNYVVKPGDTLFKISRAFDVSPEKIAEANGLVNPNLIYAGQVLIIPSS